MYLTDFVHHLQDSEERVRHFANPSCSDRPCSVLVSRTQDLRVHRLVTFDLVRPTDFPYLIRGIAPTPECLCRRARPLLFPAQHHHASSFELKDRSFDLSSFQKPCGGTRLSGFACLHLPSLAHRPTHHHGDVYIEPAAHLT